MTVARTCFEDAITELEAALGAPLSSFASAAAAASAASTAAGPVPMDTKDTDETAASTASSAHSVLTFPWAALQAHYQRLWIGRHQRYPHLTATVPPKVLNGGTPKGVQRVLCQVLLARSYHWYSYWYWSTGRAADGIAWGKKALALRGL